MHFHPRWDARLRLHAESSPRPRAAGARPFARLVTAGPTAAQLARIRQRVRDGFYASPEVMQQLAARLLDSGEL